MKLTDNTMREEMTRTMSDTGWIDGEAIVDHTAERLSGGSDSKAEALRVQLRKAWKRYFQTWDAC